MWKSFLAMKVTFDSMISSPSKIIEYFFNTAGKYVTPIGNHYHLRLTDFFGLKEMLKTWRICRFSYMGTLAAQNNITVDRNIWPANYFKNRPVSWSHCLSYLTPLDFFLCSYDVCNKKHQTLITFKLISVKTSLNIGFCKFIHAVAFVENISIILQM